MTRNIKVFLFTEAILAACGGFILPIYVLYFRYFGMTLFNVALLAAIFEATILVFEIPTGLLADRFGRKLSVIIGFALFAISGAVFIFWQSLAGFITAEVLFGLSEAFISGAAEALAVDSIAPEHRETMLGKMYTARSRIRIAASVLAMLTAGFVFSRFVEVTFVPVLLGGLAGLGIAFLFQRRPGREEDGATPRIWTPVRNMMRQLSRISMLKIIFFASLVANFSFEGADQFWQVLASEQFNIDPDYFGIITAAGALLAFILVGTIIRKSAGSLTMPLLILIMAGVAISSMPNILPDLLPYLLVVYFLGRELIKPLFSVAINRRISSAGRATFLSGYNLTCSIGEVASGLAVGFLASRLGLPIVFVACGTILVLISLVFLFAAQFRTAPASEKTA